MSKRQKKRVKQSKPWSILYVTDDELHQCGPFDSKKEAVEWATEHNHTDEKDVVDTEFDIWETRIYLLSPDHKKTELSASDLAC